MAQQLLYIHKINDKFKKILFLGWKSSKCNQPKGNEQCL